ncbi:MAG: protein kinase, partial [Planctomycetota bacterium]
IADFGLARLEADAGVTLSGDVLGKLRYMSPEQAVGDRDTVDQRSDVYSLGTTLYELLALRPAFDAENRRQLMLDVAEATPAALRTVDGRIPIDLETIANKAMEKEPSDRYAKASDMADDLRRYIDHRPIIARPPSLRERAVKWSRRHVGLVWAASLVLMAATIGLGASTWLISNARNQAVGSQRIAESERARAEQNLKLALEALDQIYTSFAGDALKDQPGMTPLREEFLTQVVEFYRRFADQNEVREENWLEVGRAYMLVGDVNEQLGRYEAAMEAYENANRVFAEMNATLPAQQDIRDLWASVLLRVGRNLVDTVTRAGAPQLLTRAIQLLESSEEMEAAVPFPDFGASTNRRALIAEAYGDLARALKVLESPDDADFALSRALESMRPLVAELPDDIGVQRLMADLWRQKSEFSISHRDVAAATDAANAAIKHRRSALAAASQSAELRRGLRDDYEQLSNLYFEGNDDRIRVGAIETWRELANAIAGDFPAVMEDQEKAVRACGALRLAYYGKGRKEESEALRKEAAARATRLAEGHDELQMLSFAALLGDLGAWMTGQAMKLGPNGTNISTEAALRIREMDFCIDAINAATYHGRMDEARELYALALEIRDELLASLADPAARQYVTEIVESIGVVSDAEDTSLSPENAN